MEFNKGSQLDKQIYPEGDSTWGCKLGVLDVEDVIEFINVSEEIITKRCMGTSANCYDIKKEIRERAGEKLTALTGNLGEGK